MNWTTLAVAAVLTFGGALYAQDDVDKQVDEMMTRYDTDKNGKATKAEYRAAVKEESGLEDENTYEWLEKWKYSLAEFLAADTDDSHDVTRAELKAYYELISAEDATKFGKLTKKDIETFDTDYLEPFVAWLMGLFDADKNGKISQKEADDKERSAVVKDYDANKDGNLDGMEIKQSEMSIMEGLFDIEEGYTLKGEPSTVEKPDPKDVPEAVRKEFESVDADKDGFITKEEMKTARMKDQPNKAYWWGVYIGFLSMDADDDLKLTLAEFASYVDDQKNGISHKFYPKDRTEAMNEIWAEVDADKDGKVTKAEWDKLFPGNDEFAGIDADSSGDASKDELWDAFKGEFKGFEFPDKDREEATPDNGGTPNPDDPMWDLYKKEGRSWTQKSTSKFMGTEMVSYMKYEVIKVAADHAVVKFTMLDKDKNAMPGVQPTETKIEFKTAKTGTPGSEPKIKDLGTETIKVEAGEFECKVTEVVTEAAGVTYTTKSWSHAKYPGLVVKSETTAKDMNSLMELAEFKE